MKSIPRLLGLTALVVTGLAAGTGVASAVPQPLTFSPAPLAFGSVHVGQSASASAMVTYTTSLSSLYHYIDIGGAAPSGPNAADFSVTGNTCSFINLAGTGYNEQCSITVRFTPSQNGPETASLQVAWHNSAGASGTQALALTGTGLGQSGGGSTTATTLSSSANPVGTGQAVTYTASVSPAPGGGTVRFTDNGTVITGCATVPVSGTTAACATTAGPAGGHNIVATFSGAGGHASSTSAVLTELVARTACPTLAGCDLHGLNFAGANLANANLAGVDLAGANLTSANLTGANLSGANLSGATLTNANLSGANLSLANLSHANLELANLSAANLSSADLDGATVVFASLGGVTWSGTTCPDGTNSNADHGTCTGHL